MTLTFEIAMTSKDTVTNIRNVLKRVHAKILFNVFQDFVVHKLYPMYIYIYIFMTFKNSDTCRSCTIFSAQRL